MIPHSGESMMLKSTTERNQYNMIASGSTTSGARGGYYYGSNEKTMRANLQ